MGRERFIWMSVILLGLSQAAFGKSGVSVDVTLTPAGSFKAKTEKVSGYAYRTQTGMAADNVVVDLTSLETGIGLRDKHTKERLLVAKHPKAKLLKVSGQNGKGVAIIEIRGQQKKVMGTYQENGNILQAQFPMQLSELGINDVRYMGIGVKDTVTINVELPIKDEPKRGTASVGKK